MADPVSAEPRNYEEDILLKLTMPGRNLRDETIKRAIEAEKKIQERERQRQNVMQDSTPIMNSFGKPIAQNNGFSRNSQPDISQPQKQVFQEQPQPIAQAQTQQPVYTTQQANVQPKFIIDENISMESLNLLNNVSLDVPKEVEPKHVIEQAYQQLVIKQEPLPIKEEKVDIQMQETEDAFLKITQSRPQDIMQTQSSTAEATKPKKMYESEWHDQLGSPQEEKEIPVPNYPPHMTPGLNVDRVRKIALNIYGTDYLVNKLNKK